jgi:hypothetical protein
LAFVFFEPSFFLRFFLGKGAIDVKRKRNLEAVLGNQKG